MRWDRLFTDLEGAALDAHAEERDALAEDLRDEQWAGLSWFDLLGDPQMRIEVAGLGDVGGIEAVGDVIVARRGDRQIVVVPEAVIGLDGPDGRAAPARRFRRTRRQVARALRDEQVTVRVVRRDGSSVEGTIEAAGADFVQLAVGTRRVSLPWTSIAALVEC